MSDSSSLSLITLAARRLYASLLTGSGREPWWTEVILTASSERQGRAYEAEIAKRREQGLLPQSARFLVIPDPDGHRLGSGGATVHALLKLAECRRGTATSAKFWRGRRVLVLHSGGDSRRLPQYSPSGKIFSPLPVRGPSGAHSTIFDETLTLSTLWAARTPSGVVVGSGDVLLIFDPAGMNWGRAGVSGVGVLQPAEVGAQHGVYVAAPDGRVLSFLQKPSVAESRNAGACSPGGQVAVDTGLVHFDPAAAARLCRLPAVNPDEPFDLYYHLPRFLTGELKPAPGQGGLLRSMAQLFAGAAFHCDLVGGEFTHIGTTSLFRHLLTEETDFARLYSARERLGMVAPEGVRSHGVIIESVVDQATIAPRAIVLESVLDGAAEIGAGAIVHGVEGVASQRLTVPGDTVLHQLPVLLPGGESATVIRAYGVGDDPKLSPPQWFGRPMSGLLEELGVGAEEVWPGVPPGQRTLWNAEIFPMTSPAEALDACMWFLGMPCGFTLKRWRRLRRASLASSAALADAAALAAARLRRARLLWERAAVRLALDGADVRPLLAQAPGISSLANVARRLAGGVCDPSRAWLASMFFAQAGMEDEAARARESAFSTIRLLVAKPSAARAAFPSVDSWRRGSVRVAAPARIDLGGGWSDTPPFCLDWGGTVLNAALLLDGVCPIETRVTRLPEPHIEIQPDAAARPMRLRTSAALFAPPAPGDPYALARTALHVTGLFRPHTPLARTLERLGGGLRIETAVNLPVGSGLGASSILAAALLQALAVLGDEPLDTGSLCDLVLELEQRMSTGGGWQDQAGGIYAGMKLLTSSPGAPQRVRCQTLDWSASRRAEFERLLVLAPTGIARVAKNLLQQVVGRYLARETAAVQVLHSIKTLALEMAHALREGAWDHLGGLLDHHWRLNQVLDPHTTNPAVDRLLAEARPFIRGAKLAGAGGGGFFIFLARDEEAAKQLRRRFRAPRTRLARHGLVIA